MLSVACVSCRTYATAARLRSVIIKFMRRALPPDAHVRCSGKTFLSLTRVSAVPWVCLGGVGCECVGLGRCECGYGWVSKLRLLGPDL
jgi:hypothetical protein